MGQTVKAVPDGQRTVTPHLVARDAAKAIDFYKRAFGAEELRRALCPQTGLVMHAGLRIGDSWVFLCDEFPGMESCRSPQSLGGSPVTIHLQVEDADALYNRAVEAGATVVMPLQDQFWGDRYGVLTDPFGHAWSIASHVEDVTAEQMSERMASFATS